MDKSDFKLHDISDGSPIIFSHNSVQRELTPEEEAAVLARAKKMCDSVTEEDWRELLRQHEQGLLVSGDEIEKMIDDIFAAHKEPA